MLLFKVKDIDIVLYVYKHEEGYSVVSSDLEGHEGLLADGLVSLKELEDLVAEVFGRKVICYGNYRSTEQLAKCLGIDVDSIV